MTIIQIKHQTSFVEKLKLQFINLEIHPNLLKIINEKFRVLVFYHLVILKLSIYNQRECEVIHFKMNYHMSSFGLVFDIYPVFADIKVKGWWFIKSRMISWHVSLSKILKFTKSFPEKPVLTFCRPKDVMVRAHYSSKQGFSSVSSCNNFKGVIFFCTKCGFWQLISFQHLARR